MKIVKVFSIFFAIIFSVLFLAFLAFYNDSSRKFIVDYAVSYLQSDNFSLKIDGANEKLTYIEKVSAKFSGNSLEVYNVSFERDELFSRPRVQIKKVIFQVSTQKSENKKEAQTESQNGFDLNETLSSVGKVKLFIESLKVDELTVLSGGNKYRYENLEYKSENDSDSVSMKTGKSHFKFVLNWSDSGTLNGDFRNLEGISGNLYMDSLKSSKPKYKVEVEKSGYKLNASGSFSDKMNTLIISQGQFQFNGKKLNFNGKILLDKSKANLSTKLSLSDFMDVRKVPTEITKNFQDILTDITIEKKGNSVNSQIEFKKDKRKLGNCDIVLQGKSLTVKSDLSWIKFWGHGVKTLDVYSRDLKNFTISILGTDILGKDIKINSEVLYGKDLTVRKFVCEFQKGQISLVRPLVLNKHNMDTMFNFNIQSLSFLNKYFKIKGSFAGDLFLKNGLLDVKAKVDNIVSEKLGIFKGKVSGNLKNLKINVGSAKFLDNILEAVNLKKKVTK
ncbi:MAG: hypothetical protein J6P84_06340 [Alphaproteobacteria bacterium]|nr:hypothetical protein [Alphaproteobacteria bacterium]